jgi:hypothetical protein
MTVKDDFEMFQKDVVFSSFETLFPHLPGKPEACLKGISAGRNRTGYFMNTKRSDTARETR